VNKMFWQVQEMDTGNAEWVSMGDCPQETVNADIKQQLKTLVTGERFAVTNWHFARVFTWHDNYGAFTATGSTIAEAEQRIDDQIALRRKAFIKAYPEYAAAA
jgi:hypothetical protein